MRFIPVLFFLFLCVAGPVRAADDGEVLDPVHAFLMRWTPSEGYEMASSQPFLRELCDLLDVPRPNPPRKEAAADDYAFERRVKLPKPNGSFSNGRIDLYKRGCFIWESKHGASSTPTPTVVPVTREDMERFATEGIRKGTALRGTKGWDTAMVEAFDQAVRYAAHLPEGEAYPPFIIVADIGHSFSVYANFSREIGFYQPYPDPRCYRFRFQDLADPTVRNLLKTIWTDPLSLDPSRRSEKVTRRVAERLGDLSVSLEKSGGYTPDQVSLFLMRIICTAYLEDVRILPAASFTPFLYNIKKQPDLFPLKLAEIWKAMATGGRSETLGKKIRHIGGFFNNAEVLLLTEEQIGLLAEAAAANWSDVNPVIFGTLLERALASRERIKLGAFFTDSTAVERLVIPTVIEPLRAEWAEVKRTAIRQANSGQYREAGLTVFEFQKRLSRVTVLDPSCGSGNFLFVTLGLLKGLEEEVLDVLRDLGVTYMNLAGAGFLVGAHQLSGIEYNPRAAAISELVLYLSQLQWHFRANGQVMPLTPILRDTKFIDCRDAVLDSDATEPAIDADGQPVTQWDGKTYTGAADGSGRMVPNEKARTPMPRYINPRPTEWPRVDYIVGNPPYVGGARRRDFLGPDYNEALAKAYPHIPASADYCLYWFDKAAAMARRGEIKRFGFITTKTIRQKLNRRLIENHLEGKPLPGEANGKVSPPLSLVYAIPDMPWTGDGAAVRVAMTVGEGGRRDGTLATMTPAKGAEQQPTFIYQTGRIGADLNIGLDLSTVRPIPANAGLCSRGMLINGNGFILTRQQAIDLGLGRIPGIEARLRPYVNGSDLVGKPRDRFIIDLYGLTQAEAAEDFPMLFHRLEAEVKPVRARNRSAKLREDWHLFESSRPELRKALSGLPRYIATPETSKHRIFVFLDAEVIPDNAVVAIASDDAYVFGILSSRIHATWAAAVGGRLGEGMRYSKTLCFDAFPFPEATAKQKAKIRKIGEDLDAARKRWHKESPSMTLTGIYNLLAEARAGKWPKAEADAIRAKQLLKIQADLDEATAEVYGLEADAAELQIMISLMDNNTKTDRR